MEREGAPVKSPEELYIQQKVRVLLMLRNMGSNLTPNEEAFLQTHATVVQSQMSQLPQHPVEQGRNSSFPYRTQTRKKDSEYIPKLVQYLKGQKVTCKDQAKKKSVNHTEEKGVQRGSASEDMVPRRCKVPAFVAGLLFGLLLWAAEAAR
ncbi:beta-catenin-interacting protein 1-like, partial [Scleropages formosus]